MDLLIIGGTRFVGRHLVQAALARGDRVTLFNRGQSGSAPDGVHQLVGDRRASLAALEHGRWDAVVDTCGFRPSEVARMAAALHGRVGRYAFVSSVSVYADAATPNDEEAPLATVADPETDVVDGDTYGGLKALCEAEVERAFGRRALCLRPGLIVGPHDPTQRFTYWPARIARAADGETVLAPGRPDAAVQLIDARDLAEFVCTALANGLSGPVNVVGPVDAPLTMGALLQTAVDVAGTRPQLRWAGMDALAAVGLHAWTDLPLALPDDAAHAGFMHADTRRARAAGLRVRPLADTVRDTLAWWRSLPCADQAFDRAGLTPEREAAALSALAAG